MRAGVVKVGLALLGIFIAGGVAGGFASVAWSRQNQERTSAREWAERQLRRRITELDLSKDQVERVRPIMLEFEEQVRGCRRKAWADLTEVTRVMNARLEEQLTPAQLDRFRDIVAKEREKFEKEMQRRSSRPDQRRDGDHPPPSPRDTKGKSSTPQPEIQIAPPVPKPSTPESTPPSP